MSFPKKTDEDLRSLEWLLNIVIALMFATPIGAAVLIGWLLYVRF